MDEEEGNPFKGGGCIDDFNSSSDDLSGMSESENMLPLVEQVQDSKSYQPPSHNHRAYPYNQSGQEYQLEVGLKPNHALPRLSNDFSLSGVVNPATTDPVQTGKEEIKNKQRSITHTQLEKSNKRKSKVKESKPKIKDLAPTPKLNDNYR